MRLHTRLMRIILFLVILVFAQTTTVYASSLLTWNIQDAVFNDGTTLTGYFTIDITNNTVTNYDFQTQAGALLAAFHYVDLPGNSTYFGSDPWGTNPNSYLFTSEVPLQGWADPMIQISSISSFLVAGINILGTDPTNDPLNFFNNVTTEFNNDNTNNRSRIRGYATTDPLSSNVPEPTFIALLATGILSFVVSRRKKNQG